MRHISERETELPDAMIGRLMQIAAERKDVISLGPGEPDFPAPSAIVAHTKKIAHLVNHYSPPEGRAELREALARKLKKKNGINVDPSNIIVTSGSQEALMLAMMCSTDANEQVIIPDPGYMGYAPCADLIYAVPVSVRLREENNFEVVPDDIERLISKKTAAIIINSPSNPTGAVLKKSILEEIAQIAIDHDLYVISDEAYEDIIYGEKHVSIGSLNGMEDYAVSLFTFSKSHAMCGYRVGYCAAPAELVKAMTKSHVYTSLSASTLSQMLALEALSLRGDHIAKMVKEYDRRRNMLVKRLNAMNFVTPMPKGAFYAFSSIQNFEKDSRKFAMALLEKAKVAVVPGSEFGKYGEGFVRCSFATKYELIEKAMDLIEEFLNKH